MADSNLSAVIKQALMQIISDEWLKMARGDEPPEELQAAKRIADRAYSQGIQEERERCVRIADSYTDGIASEACASVAHGIAAEIRASVVKP